MMKTTLLLPWYLAAGITLVAAALHGHWTNRWGPSDALPKASKVFAQLPHEFGNWQLVDSQPLAPAARGILQCHNDSQGLYKNGQTGEQVLFTLLLGPPGPMAVHTPEICYGSIDQLPLAQRQRIVLDPPELNNSAWMVQFRDLHQVEGSITRVYYAWTDGSKWDAVEEPRITFGGNPFLFKLQLLVRLPEESAAVAADPGRAFLREFLPVFANAAAPLRRTEP
jgi:Protein of unknown function (DUF3485)